MVPTEYAVACLNTLPLHYAVLWRGTAVDVSNPLMWCMFVDTRNNQEIAEQIASAMTTITSYQVSS